LANSASASGTSAEAAPKAVKAKPDTPVRIKSRLDIMPAALLNFLARKLTAASASRLFAHFQLKKRGAPCWIRELDQQPHETSHGESTPVYSARCVRANIALDDDVPF
jgi:hypothetical protein